ncbi:uncharacterized protein LOC126999886 [Eriocheir sinensis]|uniref:uncharacterized protein LOC126999886 n=1 Tax=Eriocheir sinensis TaxID=95602 RepID=UPI0021C9CBFA|nr:uncharacterized protein LOC126999886 [Eriocheir sinensis]
MMFNVTGIKVDRSPDAGELRTVYAAERLGQRSVNGAEQPNSTEFKVSLKDVSLSSSGMFTCEVISDENFETFRESANMTVIDPPDHIAGNRGPEIRVSGWGGSGPVEVQEGQRVKADCVARGANPPVHLIWYINDTEIPRTYVSPQSSRMEGHDTYTTVVSLELPARERWDSQGRLLLRCDAVIPNLYRESSVLELHNPVFRRLQQSGYFSAGSRPSQSLFLLLVWTTMVMVVVRALQEINGAPQILLLLQRHTLPLHPRALPPPPRS